GIAADGVTRVDVLATDGRHRAFIGGNAYLWIENEPNTGNQVTRIIARGPGAHRTTLQISKPDAPGQLRAFELHVPGPTRVQARIAHPTIGWYLRREQRGLSIDQARLTSRQRRELKRFDKGFTRLVKPDPLSDVVLGSSGHLCI